MHTIIKSSNKLVNKKCPKWFTPNCISKPSLVFEFGVLITPALLISTSNLFSSFLNCLTNSLIDSKELKSHSRQYTYLFLDLRTISSLACKDEFNMKTGKYALYHSPPHISLSFCMPCKFFLLALPILTQFLYQFLCSLQL